MTAEGVRAELREAAEIRADLGVYADMKRELWQRDEALDRLIDDVPALLAECDALAEQVAQAAKMVAQAAKIANGAVDAAKLTNEQHLRGNLDPVDVIAAISGECLANRAALARAEQREARVREALELAFPVLDGDATGKVTVVRVKHLLAALNEGNPDDQQQ